MNPWLKKEHKSIFNAENLPKQVLARDLQAHYRDLLDYTKNQRKPVFIMRYADPDAVLVSYELWEQICDMVKLYYKVEGIIPFCPQCSVFFESKPLDNPHHFSI